MRPAPSVLALAAVEGSAVERVARRRGLRVPVVRLLVNLAGADNGGQGARLYRLDMHPTNARREFGRAKALGLAVREPGTQRGAVALTVTGRALVNEVEREIVKAARTLSTGRKP